MKDIYRKSALDKLSSPEQLDKALKITSPLSWLALIAITIIIIAAAIWAIKGTIPVTITASGKIVGGETATITVFSNDGGEVRSILVKDGVFVKEGTSVIAKVRPSSSILNDKEIKADQSGFVRIIKVNEGENIASYAPMLYLCPLVEHPENCIVVCYVSPSEAQSIERALTKSRENDQDVTAYVNFTGSDSQKSGHLTGRVVSVDAQNTNMSALDPLIANNVSSEFSQKGLTYARAVTLELYPDKDDPSLYAWSNNKTDNPIVSEGKEVQIKIIVDSPHPYEKFLTKVKEALEGK